METYNIDPYFDDYSEDKKFYQVMFKPGMAVQTRELTQLQTILRQQIERFGNHIFENGSVVIPGNSMSELGVPYVALTKENGTEPYTASSFIGRTMIGLNYGIEAVVRKVVDEDDRILLFLKYTKGSNGQSDVNIFVRNEELIIKGAPFIRPRVIDDEDAVGMGSMAFVHRGVYYVNGTFALVDDQSIVISKDTTKPSCNVVLKVVESIVDYREDDSLVDNARGESNQNAPGADRVKIELLLEAIPLDEEIEDDCILLMRYNNGVLEEHSRYPKYSELEKSLARRTYDESGNYLVNGLTHTLKEHKKTIYNNGVDVDGDRAKFVVEIAPGKGYIEGLESESIFTRQIVLDKGRTPDHIKYRRSSVAANYGRYVYVSDVMGIPNFRNRQKIDLYNGNLIDSGGVLIGSARVVAIDYHVGDAESNSAIYKLYINDISLSAPYTMNDIAGYRYSGGSGSILTKYKTPNATADFTTGQIVTNTTSGRTAKVRRYNRSSGDMYVARHDHTKKIPVAGDFITGTGGSAPTVSVTSVESMGGNSSPPIFDIPASPLATIKNESNSYDIRYTSWEYVTVNTNSSGYAQHTVTDGEIVPIDAGTITAMTSSGIVTRDKLSIVGGNQLVITGGPASTTIYISFQVVKTGITPRIKTLTTLTLTGVTPASEISLTKCDAVRIVSVMSDGSDVTSRFVLDNGQTDYYYGLSKIILVGEMPDANLDITFEYFEHSGAGDYFSIDSYESLGPEYIAQAPVYRSISSGRDYNLGNCLDFRPRVGSSGDFETGSPSFTDMPVMDTFISTSSQYFVPRIDILALSKGGGVEVLRGIPNERPRAQSVPETMIGICSVLVPAYTVSLGEIRVTSLDNYRYTMGDINKMEKRIDGIESLSLLNSLESSVISLDVTDPVTGINKFKSGYLVDNFRIESTVCDVLNEFNMCDPFNGSLEPDREILPLMATLEDGSANFQNTGGQLTLPYTEVEFISQKVSTRITNLNPFLVVNYEGRLTLNPPFDVWTETRNLQEIVENVSVIDIEPPISRPAPEPSKPRAVVKRTDNVRTAREKITYVMKDPFPGSAEWHVNRARNM